MIPQGLILIWPSTVATIPAGWERVTDLDDKHIKGALARQDPNTTGGANTHSHVGIAHTHNPLTHTHSGRLPDPDTSGGWTKLVDGSPFQGGENGHYHTFSTTYALSGGILTGTVAYPSVNHEPPYRKVIFIRPINKIGGIPDGVIAFIATSTVRPDWAFCNGASGTPDLLNRYLKGAETGQGADVTTSNGALTHIHVLDHTHSAVNHGHSGLTDVTVEGRRDDWGGGPTLNSYIHEHYFTLGNTSTTPNAYTGSLTSDTVEPSYLKLVPVKNVAGRTVGVFKGLIGLWLGTIADIPAGWLLCNGLKSTPDMRDKFPKCAGATSEAGNTGGSHTHAHAASNSHAHGTVSHTHSSFSVSQNGYQIAVARYGSAGGIQDNHTHPNNQGNQSCSTTNMEWENSTISAESVNNEPAYRTVAFLQFAFSVGQMSQVD